MIKRFSHANTVEPSYNEHGCDRPFMFVIAVIRSNRGDQYLLK